jgi:hypothetical protein
MENMADVDVATTAVELWRALQEQYGLDTTTYDSDLVNDIRSALGLPDMPMETALAHHEVTVEELLHAVLLSLQPFAAMQTDLLRLFDPGLPPLQPTGQPDLDRILRRVHAVAEAVLRGCRTISTDRNDLARRFRERNDRDNLPTEADPGVFALVDTDNWLWFIVEALESVTNRVNDEGLSSERCK